MNPFVGVKEVSSVDELKKLIEARSLKSFYFFKWPHKVSEITNKFDEFPSPEGQMFNHEVELRWKQKGQGFSILLLSVAGLEPEFTPVGKSWQIQDRNAHIHRSNETRFPKPIKSNLPNIAQRYFIDAETSIVHFVALTLYK